MKYPTNPLAISGITAACLLTVFALYFVLTIRAVVTTTTTFSNSDSAVATTEVHKTWVNKDGIRLGF